MSTLLPLLSKYELFSGSETLKLTPLERQGHCNHHYLLQSDTGCYIIREFGREARDRALEYHIQSIAYRHGLAPQPLLLDLSHGFMISSYTQGTHIEQLSHPELKLLAETLKHLHSITIATLPIVTKSIQTNLDRFSYDPVLCHHDLNPYNLIWHDRLTLIDWEYAGVNDRYFDLASIIVEFKLSKTQKGSFLDHYFKGESWSEQKLHAYIRIYKELCTHWWAKRQGGTSKVPSSHDMSLSMPQS